METVTSPEEIGTQRTIEPVSESSKTKDIGIESWRFGYGDYSVLPSFKMSTFVEADIKEVSIESFLRKSIDDLIRSRQRPIVVLDFGSTQAHSFVRMAKDYEGQIRKGELILVASNLSHKPDEDKENKIKDEYEGINIGEINKRAIPEYYKYSELVIWVNGRAEELTSVSVKDVNGKPFSLSGAVNLINESSVFQHVKEDDKTEGNTPDEKIKNTVSFLKSLLSDNGLLISTDLPVEYSDEIPEPKIFDRIIVSKGRGVDLVTNFQDTFFRNHESQIRKDIERIKSEIKKGSIPKGYDISNLEMINSSREKQIRLIESMLTRL